MKAFNFNNELWPFTGRKAPDGAELLVIVVHPKWRDLMWHDKKRDLLVYLSTLPA